MATNCVITKEELTESLRGVAVLFFNRQELEEAIQYINEAVACDETNLACYRDRARIEMMLAQYDHAVKDFDKALEAQPDNALLRCLKGYSLLALEKKTEGFAEFNKAKADPLQANIVSEFWRRLDSFGKKEPSCLAKWFGHRDEDQYYDPPPGSEERRVHPAYMESDGKNDGVATDEEMAEALRVLATKYEQGQLDLAIRDLSLALEYSPGNVEIYHERADCFLLENEPDLAWQDLEKAESLDADLDPGRLLCQMAACLTLQGDHDEARQKFNEAVLADEANAEEYRSAEADWFKFHEKKCSGGHVQANSNLRQRPGNISN